MLNLKPYFDALNEANGKVLSVAGSIDTAFQDGTAEGKEKALGMRAELDAAQADAEQALKLYESMKKAGATGDAAARFVPVNDEAKADGKKVATRAEYEAMSYQDRHDFFSKGGSLVGPEEE